MVVPRQNCDPSSDQLDRSVCSFASFRVFNLHYAAPDEASVRFAGPVLLLLSRSALGESIPAAAACRSEAEAPTIEIQSSVQVLRCRLARLEAGIDPGAAGDGRSLASVRAQAVFEVAVAAPPLRGPSVLTMNGVS